MSKRPPAFNFAGWARSLLPGLAVVFGLQLLRSFIPSLAWYLKDTRSVPTLGLIPYALGTFCLGYLAAILARLLGGKAALWVTVGGLALARVLEQISFDPGLDLYFCLAGLGFFLNFLAIYLGISQADQEGKAFPWVSGLVWGFAADVTLMGIFGFRGLSSIPGWGPLVLVILLAGGMIWRLVRETSAGELPVREGAGKQALSLLAVGPYFALQLLFLANPGWLEEVSGLPFPGGFLLVSAGFLLGAGGLVLGFARPLRQHPSLALGLGLVLIYGIYYADQLGPAAVLLVLGGQFILGWGLAAISSAARPSQHRSLWRTVLALNSGMVLFLILSFAYYAAQDIALPISRASFPAIAAGLLAGAMVWACVQIRSRAPGARSYEVVGAVGLLALAALVCWAVWGGNPSPPQNGKFPVKVMDYNIHSSYNIAGRQDLEGIASVIEQAGAEIIGLQEVSRTRLMDGSADMPTWLARRLDMYYVFQGTDEPIWGNAILSRYPILDSGYQALPREGSLIGRGFLWALIDIGEEEPLLVTVTHLHQIVADRQVRMAQVPELVDFLAGREQALLLGDFNAQPDSPEIGLLYKAGLVDSWLESGTGTGYTDASNHPVKRIDYLWHSPDLEAVQIQVIQTQASDHMPVLGLIQLKR